MNNISLYIENKEVELNERSIFAITRQFEEVVNPTIIINDWSKTIQIPATRKNNEIFGYIYNPDRVIVNNPDSTTGLSFDPFKKLSFRLEYSNDVLMTGYAKNIYVTRNGSELYYNITLNGEIGKLFQEMQKITFDPAETDTDYIIDGSDYIKGNINKDTILNCWNSTGQRYSYLIPTSNPLYRLTDIIGFVPNNSFTSNFDYNTYQSKINTSNTFVDTLGDSFKADTGIDAETVIPNGMLPREIGEYRSYLQQPYIWFNKLFHIFRLKAQRLTGYTFSLDINWFTTKNPYWYNLVYMLKMLDTENVVESMQISSQLTNTDSNGLLIDSQANAGVDGTKSYTNILTGDDIVLTGHKGSYNINSITFALNWLTAYSNIDYFGQAYKVPILTFKLQGSNNTITVAKVAIVGNRNPFKANLPTDLTQTIITERSDSTNENYRWAYKEGILRTDISPYKGGYYVNIDEKINVNVSISNSILKSNNYTFTPVCSLEWYNTYTGGFNYPYEYADSYGDAFDNTYSWFGEGSEISIIGNAGVNVNVPQRSNTPLYMSNLWDKNYNLFNEILNYCKMFRIGIFCDSNNKILKFRQLSTYFKDYKILDWNDKIDYSQEMIIKPISFENKYVNFNYQDIKTDLGEKYKEKYGVNYGDYLLTTNYNFNDSTEDLFKYAKGGMVSTDNVLSWTNLYDNHRIVYSLPTELYVNLKDKDSKYVSPFGSYFFHNGLATFNVGGNTNMRQVYITDDTSLQSRTGTFFYSQSIDFVRATTYPLLTPVYNNNLCMFKVPAVNYTYNSGLYTGKADIYYNFWENYIKERYNKQNKIVTCWVRLTPIDYANFEFNNFVKIENQLYFVNKIYDYSPTNDYTKVDLITIQDINGYIKNNYKEPTLIVTDSNGKAIGSETHISQSTESLEWFITSSSDWTWDDLDKSLQEFYINGTNGSGSGVAGVNIPLHITLEHISSGDNGIIVFENEDGLGVSTEIYID